ncbi:hypothetical protein HHK36_007147 [Tetracentron sinense]|uniref:Germin-like protein n=1 Tax=Tetracentron sinense TaxID=13715 RepID=A0A834ZT03_TETSI|nr:hypothetical protein HHK36_007147 [Tetracentron sinense]
MSRVDLAPGAINPPHSHPRASQIGVIIKGKVLVGFVTTANVFYSKVLKAGDMFVIPRGLVHFELNVGKGKALFLPAFNSQMPGIVILPTTLFASTPPIPNDVLTKGFQIDAKSTLETLQTIFVNGFPCKPLSEVKSDDFFFDGLRTEGNTTNVFGSKVTSAFVTDFPGLNTLGILMSRVDLAPGGINPPHSHPRASQTGVIIKGKVLVGFVTTANVFYSKVLKAGDMFVIPRGLVHFELNVGKGKALFLPAFNSQLPGLVVLPTTLFASTPPIPNDVLTKGFLIDAKVISDIRSKLGS